MHWMSNGYKIKVLFMDEFEFLNVDLTVAF